MALRFHLGSYDTPTETSQCGRMYGLPYGTIGLIPRASKIMLKIIMKRIEGKAMNAIDKTQFCFGKGMGTREAIGTMKMLC